MNEALLIVGHGSRDAEGVEEFLELGRVLAGRRAARPTGVAFLEFARPTIEERIERLVAAGAERIVCQPGMLFAAGHVKNDVPSEVQAAMRRWPGVEFRMGRALDVHAKLLELCRVRWYATLAARPQVPATETMLLVVGRGASDPEANADVAKISRFLWEGYGVGWAAACYSGVTKPLVPDALEVAARSGFRRIVVQPYFIFTGVLVKKIHQWTRECAARHPELEVFATEHLGVHPLLADVFEERAAEAVGGSPNMNCQLCKYRVQIVGHESAVGLPQAGHHHHVRGLDGHVHHLHDEHDSHDHSHAQHDDRVHDLPHDHARDALADVSAASITSGHLWDDRLIQYLAF